MNTKSALNRLKTVWSDSGAEAPQATETNDALRLRKESPRSPKHGGVQVSLRITKEEKKRFEMVALREDLSLNEVFSRMLALYEREHGRVELSTKNEE